MPAGVGEVGVGPENDVPVREKIARVLAERWLRDDLETAGLHDAQRPGSDLDRLVAVVARGVPHGDVGIVVGERDPEGLDDPPGLRLERINHDLIGEFLDPVIHRMVVNVVGEHLVLRGDPEPVAAADLPSVLTGSAKLVVVGLEDVFSGGALVGNDARPDIEGDDDFCMVVREKKIPVPAGVGDKFFFHGIKSPLRASEIRCRSTQSKQLLIFRERALSRTPVRPGAHRALGKFRRAWNYWRSVR